MQQKDQIYLSIYLSICLSNYLSIYLSICLSVYMSLSVCLSVYLSIYLSNCLSVCLSACLPACLPVCLSVCLSIHLSIYLSSTSENNMYLCIQMWMSVLLTTEDVLRCVPTLLDHFSVVAKVDSLSLAMDSHALVCTDCASLQLTLLQVSVVSVFLPTQM